MTQINSVKGGFIALAVLLFGGMLFALNANSYGFAILFLVLTVVVAFFAIIMEIPAQELPTDLRSLQTLLTGVPLSVLQEIVAFLQANQSEIDQLITSGNLQELLTVIQEILAGLTASGVSAKDIATAITKYAKAQ
jgi:hypothetical protein